MKLHGHALFYCEDCNRYLGSEEYFLHNADHTINRVKDDPNPRYNRHTLITLKGMQQKIRKMDRRDKWDKLKERKGKQFISKAGNKVQYLYKGRVKIGILGHKPNGQIFRHYFRSPLTHAKIGEPKPYR